MANLTKERKVAVKERLRQEQLIQVLRQVLTGLENTRNFNMTIKGQQCEIPAETLSKATMEVEYERDRGKIELEISIEWPED